MVQEKYLITNDYKTASIEILVENLAALRARIGITQEELANIIGVSRQTYYSLETGKREINRVFSADYSPDYSALLTLKQYTAGLIRARGR